MTDEEKQQAVITFVAALLTKSGAGKMDEIIDDAMACADALDKKLKGETDSEEENGEDDGENSEGESEEEEGNEEDESQEEDDDGEAVDDGEADDDSEEEDSKKKQGKKSGRSTATAGKAGKATKSEVKDKKTFKKKPQAYARDNDTHKEIFSGILKAVAPKWKTDPKTKTRAKGASVKLEGSEFLDAEGDVLASFKSSVKKLMAVK